MNKTLKSMAFLALASSVAFAGEPSKEVKDMQKKMEDQAIYVETAKPGVVLSGYVDAGYTYNFNGAGGGNSTQGTGGGTTAGNVRGNDNQAKGDFNLNAFKLAIEKPLGTKNDFEAGFRVDLVYGEDASTFGRYNGAGNGATTAAGQDSGSDFYVQQAFAQFRAPVGNGIDFKVGKFGSYYGYEAPERAANLNITHGAVWWLQGGQQVGVKASYKINDIVDISGTVNNGYQTSNGFNTTNGKDAYGFGGMVNVTAPGGNANIQQSFDYAPVGDQAGVGTSTGNFFLYDVWGQWKPKITGDKLLLAYNIDYGQTDTTPIATASNSTIEHWYGLALYSKYQFTKIFSLAGRAEYIYNSSSQLFAAGNATSLTPSASIGKSTELYAYTLTSSFDVWENLLLRAEYRVDMGPSFSSTSDKFGASHLIATEVVYSF